LQMVSLPLQRHKKILLRLSIKMGGLIYISAK